MVAVLEAFRAPERPMAVPVAVINVMPDLKSETPWKLDVLEALNTPERPIVVPVAVINVIPDLKSATPWKLEVDEALNTLESPNVLPVALPNESRFAPRVEVAVVPVAVWKVRVFTVKYPDRKSTRLNSSHIQKSRMPSSA